MLADLCSVRKVPVCTRSPVPLASAGTSLVPHVTSTCTKACGWPTPALSFHSCGSRRMSHLDPCWSYRILGDPRCYAWRSGGSFWLKASLISWQAPQAKSMFSNITWQYVGTSGPGVCLIDHVEPPLGYVIPVPGTRCETASRM